MSKTYYTSGTGAQQTLANAQDEKIPIYENEAALDADMSNLKVGQIVGTKSGHDDVIDDMKAYIRNQNLLSDYESITISDDSNNPTIMDYDGFICLTNQSGVDGYGNFVINGVQWQTGGRAQGWATATIPIKKGDSVYRSTWTSSNDYYCLFYKLRDYSNRQ